MFSGLHIGFFIVDVFWFTYRIFLKTLVNFGERVIVILNIIHIAPL